MTTSSAPSRTDETYRVSVQQFVTFRQQGYLVVPALVPAGDVAEMNEHMDRMLAGQETIGGARIMKDQSALSTRPEDWLRVHMLHRLSPLHERFLLHPRILDVLEALIGPDVLALQSMLFFKQPGQTGQGYHQDSYYIPTFPDTLCGAWLALTPATIQNGCLWYRTGSQNEPIYPDPKGHGADLTANLADLGTITHASDTDETVNGLTRVAEKYPETAVEANPGDVVFFGGHIIHRSHTNQSDTPRRSFVGHYSNAHSWVPWNHGDPFEGESANDKHILARGWTHLPFAQPAFGTACAATQPDARGRKPGKPASMMAGDDEMMMLNPHSTDPDDE